MKDDTVYLFLFLLVFLFLCFKNQNFTSTVM
uniref:Uncharacterized protein n=1 Tax=Anguilla anguilla TaxID=7936 RepID=A0A0E9XQW1_ANGAN